MAFVIALTTTACSFQMAQVPKGWDGSYDPACTTDLSFIFVDGVMASAGAAFVIAEIKAENPPEALAGLLLLVPFTVSAIAGGRRIRECEEARAAHRAASDAAARDQANGESDAPSERPRTPPAPAPAPSPPKPAPNSSVPPRGFFCASSAAAPDAGFCEREEAACQRAREAALAAVADLDACRLVESAFCHEVDGAERCAPTMAACTARAGSQPCAERQ